MIIQIKILLSSLIIIFLTNFNAIFGIDIKIATSFEKGTDVYTAAEKFTQLIDTYSKGQIKVQFFSGKAIGSEQDQIQGLKTGTIDIAVNGTLIVQQNAKEYAFIASPFILIDYEHFKRIYKGNIGSKINESLIKNNIRTIGFFYRGLRHFTSSKPLKSALDFEGLKLRITTSAIYDKIYKGLGCDTMQISLPELYASLQRNIAEASDGPASQINTYRLYEVQKYLVLSGHQVALGSFCINEDFYKKLSKEDKAILDKAAAEAIKYSDEITLKNENELIDKLSKSGMTIIRPDMKSIRLKVKPVMDQLFKDEWNVTTWDEINKM